MPVSVVHARVNANANASAKHQNHGKCPKCSLARSEDADDMPKSRRRKVEWGTRTRGVEGRSP